MERGYDSCGYGYEPWTQDVEKVKQLKHLKQGDIKTEVESARIVMDIIYKPIFTRGGNEHEYRAGNV